MYGCRRIFRVIFYHTVILLPIFSLQQNTILFFRHFVHGLQGPRSLDRNFAAQTEGHPGQLVNLLQGTIMHTFIYTLIHTLRQFKNANQSTCRYLSFGRKLEETLEARKNIQTPHTNTHKENTAHKYILYILHNASRCSDKNTSYKPPVLLQLFILNASKLQMKYCKLLFST